MSTYVKTEIGFLLADGHFICRECWFDYMWPTPACPVYHVNIGDYSQTCHSCDKLVIDGWKSLRHGKRGEPLCLFDKPTTPQRTNDPTLECESGHIPKEGRP